MNLGDLNPTALLQRRWGSLLAALGVSLIMLLLMSLEVLTKQLKLQLPIKIQCAGQRCTLADELVRLAGRGDRVRFGAHPRGGLGTSAAGCPSNCQSRAASITPNISEPLSCLQYSEAAVMERCWGISVTHITLLFILQQSQIPACIRVSHCSNLLTGLLV